MKRLWGKVFSLSVTFCTVATHTRNLSKLEALQQVQIALITGNYSAVEGERRTVTVVSEASGLPASVRDNLDYPYYWDVFILIGNGL